MIREIATSQWADALHAGNDRISLVVVSGIPRNVSRRWMVTVQQKGSLLEKCDCTEYFAQIVLLTTEDGD
jgi:hypothetical protein